MKAEATETQTGQVTLTSRVVDVEGLPSLLDLFEGELETAWRMLETDVIADIWKANHAAPRVITCSLGFTPEADLSSCKMRVKSLRVHYPGTVPPPVPQRLAIRRSQDRLTIRAVTGLERPEREAPGDPPFVPVDKVPGLYEFSDRFTRQLVRVALNLEDPHAEIAKERLISWKVKYTGDEDLATIRRHLESMNSRLAGIKSANAATFYLNFDRGTGSLDVNPNPSAWLPDDDGEPQLGRQANFTTN